MKLGNLLAVCLLSLSAAVAAHAQQITGVLGSPAATITIDGKQLPPPDPKFGGVIKERASESTPWWAPALCRRRAHPTCCSS